MKRHSHALMVCEKGDRHPTERKIGAKEAAKLACRDRPYGSQQWQPGECARTAEGLAPALSPALSPPFADGC